MTQTPSKTWHLAVLAISPLDRSGRFLRFYHLVFFIEVNSRVLVGWGWGDLSDFKELSFCGSMCFFMIVFCASREENRPWHIVNKMKMKLGSFPYFVCDH